MDKSHDSDPQPPEEWPEEIPLISVYPPDHPVSIAMKEKLAAETALAPGEKLVEMTIQFPPAAAVIQ